MRDEIANIKNQAISQIMDAKTLGEIETVRASYLGKKGKLAKAIKDIAKLPTQERRHAGVLINETKQTLNQVIARQKQSFQDSAREWFDPTVPGEFVKYGNLHPTSIVIKEMFEIFKHLGFSIMEGPEIETDIYNFESLNLPKDHPARSLQDALYIKEPDVILRSHTSSVESRSIESLEVPFRIMVAGKSYRYENVNASNNAMFYQFQGVALQEGLSMADLKGTLYYFAHEFFGKNRKIRFRCKYYPEVEPGGGLDLDCPFCNQKGCSVCKGRGWLEMLGCGMIHPNILKRYGYDPKKISGFAFGMGLDRIVMDKFKIDDIRNLYNGSITYQS